MSTLMFALVVAMASADSGSTAGATAAVAPRRYHEIERDISEALRSEARAQEPQTRAEAVRTMCAVYRELATDPRLATSDELKSYKAKLWSRLTRIKRELEQRVARQTGTRPGRGPSEAESQAIQDAATSLAAQMSYSNYTLGGPAYVLSHSGAAFGGGAVNDHAQELIELIQRTISPNFWDVAGGPGSMFYYRPLMALVVRATSEVHDDVGGVPGALRRAGM